MGFLARIGIGFAGGLGIGYALAPALAIVFGQRDGAVVGGLVNVLSVLAMLGLAAGSATAKLALGRSLKVVGVSFLVAVALAFVMRYPVPMSESAAARTQDFTIGILAIGGAIGGLLFLAGYILTHNPEPGRPGLLARILLPRLSRLSGGMIGSRRIDAYRRMAGGLSEGVDRFDESLPYLRGFNHYYREKIQPWLRQQETSRKDALRHRIKVLVIGMPIMGVATPFVIAWLGDEIEGFWESVVACLVGLAWLLLFAEAFSRGDDLQKKVKAFMIDRLSSFFRLTYLPEKKSLDLTLFADLGLVPQHGGAEILEGFSGQRDGVSMFMAEANVYGHRGTTAARRYRKTLFHGAVLNFSCPKRFDGRTVILPDGGWIGNKVKSGISGKNFIRLENPEFEKHFEVHCDDEVEARYLLTPAFMERAVRLAELLGSSAYLRFAFADNRLLVAVTGWDLFETASLAHAMDNPIHVQTFLNEVGLVLDIAETLKLAGGTRV